jgi:WD40 repeat protein
MSEDGSIYVAQCADSKFHVWNAVDGKQLSEIDLPTPFTDLQHGALIHFVRGDDLVISATQNNRAWAGIWSLRDGARRSLLPDRPASPSSLLYWVQDVNHERQALVAEDSHHVRVRDLMSGHVIAERATVVEIRNSRWTADGNRVFVGFADGHVEMLDSRTLGTLGSFQSDLGTLDQVWPDHSGGQLAVTSTDGVIQFWPSTSRPSERRTLQGRNRPIFNFAFSPDGSFVAIFVDEIMKLWTTSDGTLRKSFGVSPGLYPLGFAFYPDGQHLVACTNDGSVQTWDIAAVDLPALRGHASYVYPAVFAAGGSMIVSGGWDGFVGKPGSLRVWDALSGDPVASFIDGELVRAIAMAPDGVSAAIGITGPETYSVMLLDLRTGHQRPLLDPVSEWAGSLAFDPTGRRIAVGCVMGVVRVVDVGSGKVVFERTQGQSTWLNEPRVAWSPDGRTLAVSDDDGTIELLETERFATRLRLAGHVEYVRALVYSHDGKLLTSGGRDRTVRIWDARTGRSVAVLRGHEQEVLAVAFSPDGRRLASGGYDATVRLWDTTSWEQVAALSGHEWYVYSLDWSPDGERLISGSGDGTVRIWETKPIEERHREVRERRETLARIVPVVKRWLDELGDGKAVAGRIARDAQFGPRDREIALEALLTESVERRSNVDSPSAAMRPERIPEDPDRKRRASEPVRRE